MSQLRFILTAAILLEGNMCCFGSSKWRRLEAIAGREAILPCEVGSIDSNDMIFVVLWYKGDSMDPIYSYDNRPRDLHAAEHRHVVREGSLKERVTFRPGSVPALHIKPVLRSDAANYTCRVDFRIAASRSTRLTLLVVVPPDMPVLQLGGRILVKRTLGPLLEGEPFRISCTVSGGEPPPSVVWLLDSEVLDTSVEMRVDFRSVNHLHVLHLSRRFHGARLTCRVANNDITPPHAVSLTITMHLKPLLTSLSSPPREMRLGQTYEIECIVAGSRPAPNVTWTLDNVASQTMLTSVEDHAENVTISRVKLKAERGYHRHRLTCSAFSAVFPAKPLSDSTILNITYPPFTTLELGRGVQSTIREGEDVYFNCNVDSNPATYKISWFHENRTLHPEPHSKIFTTGESLVIRDVERRQGGRYTCSASNVEGDARSNPVFIDVSFAPVCQEVEPAKRVLAVGLRKPLNVTCRVLASPSADLRFSWVFNNSMRTERVSGDKVLITNDGKSMVMFWARTLQEYGTLQCWAQNSVGKMSSPCLYHVVPAGRPDSPLNCSVVNKTYVSLVVTCTPGFDGGLDQSFQAQIFESVTGRSQVNVTSNAPSFTLSGLTPGLDYVIQVKSINDLGHSDPVRLEAFTYKMAENRMRDESPKEEEAPKTTSVGLAELLVGSIFLGLLLVGVVAAFGRCLVSRRRSPPQEESHFSVRETYVSQDVRVVDGENTILFEVPPPLPMDAVGERVAVADQAL